MTSIPRGKRRISLPRMRLSFNDPVFRSLLFQVLAVGGVVFVVWYLASNTVANLEARRIATGFGFLSREAGFGIQQTLIEYTPANTYLRALVVGLLNTLLVAVLGIFLSTILGTLIGIGRLSKNWLIAKLCSVYVEVIRNIPLALQLVFLYAIKDLLPPVRQAFQILPDVFLSQRGLMIPILEYDPSFPWMGVACVLGIAGAVFFGRWARARQAATGQQAPTLAVSAALIVGLPLLVFLAAGAPLKVDAPTLQGFNFAGGLNLSPELTTLLFGLVIYTSAFNAEIVRSGILAISHGQTEAAFALGLQRGQSLRLVILPQALRVIVPPMTSQYLNLTKNSTLALLIGYPDLVSVANTTLNQTGQAIEGVAIEMGTFLAISLSISLFLNWYNKKIALVGR